MRHFVLKPCEPNAQAHKRGAFIALYSHTRTHTHTYTHIHTHIHTHTYTQRKEKAKTYECERVHGSRERGMGRGVEREGEKPNQICWHSSHMHPIHLLLPPPLHLPHFVRPTLTNASLILLAYLLHFQCLSLLVPLGKHGLQGCCFARKRSKKKNRAERSASKQARD